MISPEIIRRYPFFAGLSFEQIVVLADVSEELEVDSGHYFLHEGDAVPFMYLVVEGTIHAVIELPGQEREIAVGSIGPGEVFGWSALIPPHTATATVKSISPAEVVKIDCHKLLEAFEHDPRFGYQMMTKAAQVTRDRVATMNIETLAYYAEPLGV